MSDVTNAKHPDYKARHRGHHLHRLLEDIGAIKVDAVGLSCDPPRLMTVEERIRRLGDDRMNFHNQAKWLQKQLERTGK